MQRMQRGKRVQQRQKRAAAKRVPRARAARGGGGAAAGADLVGGSVGGSGRPPSASLSSVGGILMFDRIRTSCGNKEVIHALTAVPVRADAKSRAPNNQAAAATKAIRA